MENQKGIDEIIDLFSWLYFYQSKSAQSSANSNRAVWFICWKLLTYWADVHNFVYISILMADACKVDCSHCHFSMFVREVFFSFVFFHTDQSYGSCMEEKSHDWFSAKYFCCFWYTMHTYMCIPDIHSIHTAKIFAKFASYFADSFLCSFRQKILKT